MKKFRWCEVEINKHAHHAPQIKKLKSDPFSATPKTHKNYFSQKKISKIFWKPIGPRGAQIEKLMSNS